MLIQMKGVWSSMGDNDSYEEEFECQSDNLIDGVGEFLKEVREYSDSDVDDFKSSINKGWRTGYEWKLTNDFGKEMLLLNSGDVEERYTIISQ